MKIWSFGLFSVMALVVILLFMNISPIKAETAKSDLGGMNLAEWCHYAHGDVVYPKHGKTACGWRCVVLFPDPVVGETDFAINFDAVCRENYDTKNVSAHTNKPKDSNSWSCFLNKIPHDYGCLKK